MGVAAAADSLQMHNVLHASQASCLDGVAGFISPLIYRELFAAILEHFGHHEKPITCSALVKGCKDFARTTDGNDLSNT
jgi:hypothetical protein